MEKHIFGEPGLTLFILQHANADLKTQPTHHAVLL